MPGDNNYKIVPHRLYADSNSLHICFPPIPARQYILPFPKLERSFAASFAIWPTFAPPEQGNIKTSVISHKHFSSTINITYKSFSFFIPASNFVFIEESEHTYNINIFFLLIFNIIAKINIVVT